MRKTDVLYLKTQRLIAETHRDTEGYTKRHTEKYSQRHTVIQKDTHKETTVVPIVVFGAIVINDKIFFCLHKDFFNDQILRMKI